MINPENEKLFVGEKELSQAWFDSAKPAKDVLPESLQKVFKRGQHKRRLKSK